MRTYKKGDWVVVKEGKDNLVLWKATDGGSFTWRTVRPAVMHDFEVLLIQTDKGKQWYDPEIHGTVFVSKLMTLVSLEDEFDHLYTNMPGQPIKIPKLPMPQEVYVAHLELSSFYFEVTENEGAVTARSFNGAASVIGDPEQVIAASYLQELLGVAHMAAKGSKKTKKAAIELLRKLHQV